MLFKSIAPAGVVCCVAAVPASADVFDVTVTFSSLVNGQGYNNQLFTGSASFTYDDSVFTGRGREISSGTLDAFTLSPSTVGSTLFDASNTGYDIVYLNGALDLLSVGGTPDGTGGIGETKDDILVVYRIGTPFVDSVFVSTPNGSFFSQTNGNVTAVVTPVPEPTTAALLGAAGLAVLRRRPRG